MFKNWKTTLGGVIFGALYLMANGMTPKQIAVAAAGAAIGAVSKDWNISHTKP